MKKTSDDKNEWIKLEKGTRKYDKIILNLDIYIKNSKYFNDLYSSYETYMLFMKNLEHLEKNTEYRNIGYILETLGLSPKDYTNSIVVGNMYGSMKVDKQYSYIVYKNIKSHYKYIINRFEFEENVRRIKAEDDKVSDAKAKLLATK